MVDLKERLFEIRRMIDRGDYFTINRARQYGKTTMLFALEAYLKDDYLVIHLDFQDLDESAWSSVADFVSAFADEILTAMELSGGVPEEQLELLRTFADRTAKKMNLKSLFTVIGDCCKNSDQPVVLMIDEVDAASDYDVFLDFLAQLRARYIRRSISPTFQSVILVGVHDIRNLKRKFVAAGEHSTNSPWNVAADFTVDMSFYTEDIAGMLRDYEKDYATGMNVNEIAQEIYNYTSGYPFLVSRICKLLDERIQGTEKFPDRASVWSRDGVIEAVGMIVMEKNTLFESLIDKVNRYTDLREIVYDILMKGEEIPFNPLVESISVASMYGFIRDVNSKVAIANRIFETILYNYFLVCKEGDKTEIYRLGAREKIQFIREDGLDMERILERFVVSFNELYGDQPQKFKEDDGKGNSNRRQNSD
ncbi:MAG: AAA-like domain-containing protein [Clostridiales bacterium]|nr:AAA-like domain-containing protein [Clostridiales bacterium]